MSDYVQFVTNQKMGKTALYGGYQYSYAKTNKEKKHWRCIKYHVNRCPGRITKVEENVVKVSDHSHAPDARQSEKRVALSTIRTNAIIFNSPPRKLIRRTTSTMTKTSAVELTDNNTLARNIRRIRSNANTTPKLPPSLLELEIIGEYAQTIDGRNFLLYDNKDPLNRIAMFATKANLTFLIHCDDWYMDGTFDVTPPFFKKLYTIHGRRNGRHFPLVYVLTCKKDYFTYETVFSQLKLAEPRLNPKKVMMDFEKAAIKAAEDVFKDVEVNGCFFHFCQCIYRQIQGNGLQKSYTDDPTFALHMRCLASLAFVPEDDVVRSFESLKEFTFFKKALKGTSPVDIGVQKLLVYMEGTWIGSSTRRSYKPGTFPVKLWNVYRLTLDLFPRTNNAVEAWHNAINLMFGVYHPNIFKFISGIKVEQNDTEIVMDKMFAGIVVANPTNSHYEKIQKRILSVVRSYVDRNKFDLEKYLVGLAQSVHFSS